jgi:hypothetical protein
MSSVESALDAQEDKARRKADSGTGWYAVLARTGLVAKGLSFALVGALAIKLALGSGGSATSRQGALAQLAHQSSFGKIALIALALGFAAYALWRTPNVTTARTATRRSGASAPGMWVAGSSMRA